jgi:hypothetical protein
MTTPPSERFLVSVECELRKRPPGTQRAVGGGVYMRLDRGGRRRFQYRGRLEGAQAGGTYDRWQDAADALAGIGETALAEALDAAEASREQIRAWTIGRYAQEWWRHVLTLDVLTQQDYRRALDDLLPLVRGVTLAQLETAPLLADEIKDRIKKAKTHPPRGKKHRGKKARLHRAAADKLLRAICQHALERQIISRNPFAGLPNFNRRRGAAGDPKAPSHRRHKYAR